MGCGSMERDFKFWMPLDVKKSTKEGEMRIGGIATDESAHDIQGETVFVNGLDISYLTQRGAFNWDHGKGPGDILGEIDLASKQDSKLYVEGTLYPHNKQARDVFNLMRSLEDTGSRRKLGLSLEGKVKERDSETGKQIRKAWIKNVAITYNPINQGTWVDMIKSLGNFTFDSCDCEDCSNCDEDFCGLDKSLPAGEADENKSNVQPTAKDATKQNAVDKSEEKLEKLEKIDSPQLSNSQEAVAPASNKLEVSSPEAIFLEFPIEDLTLVRSKTDPNEFKLMVKADGCPGSKIRSGGKGLGLGTGQGKGPIGIPVGKKEKEEAEEKEEVKADGCPGSKIRSEGKGLGLGTGKGKGPIGVPVGKKEEVKKADGEVGLEAGYDNPATSGGVSGSALRKESLEKDEKVTTYKLKKKKNPNGGFIKSDIIEWLEHERGYTPKMAELMTDLIFKAVDIKGYIRTRRGQLERVKPYTRELTHELYRIKTMSDEALATRARKITHPEKLLHFYHAAKEAKKGELAGYIKSQGHRFGLGSKDFEGAAEVVSSGLREAHRAFRAA